MTHILKFNESKPGWRLLAWCLFLSLLPVAAAQSELKVDQIEIRHVGPPAASEARVRANIKISPGDIYNPVAAQDDVKSLYSTGLFYNIEVRETASPAGGVTLVYLLQGNPVLMEVQFEGNEKYSDKKLRKEISSKVGEPISERKLFMDSRTIQQKYEKAGRQRTEVKYRISIDEAQGRGAATFEIAEAPKVRIEEVEFEGASAFSQRKLRKVLKTRRHWFLSWLTGSGVLKDDQFKDDKERLAEFYRSHGYIDFEIREVEFDYVDPRRLIVRFELFEGRQYNVGSVEMKGNSIFLTDEVQRVLMMGPGEIFTPGGLASDVEAIRDFYGARGYIDTWVQAQKIPNVETGTMDLVYQVIDEERGVSYIEKIEVRGNTKTKDRVIRRELAVSPGEVFDMVRVKNSRGRLEQMGYFDKVNTDTEPTDISNRKNLVIDVEEGSTGNVELGAGFSSVDSLVGFVGYREGNFDLFNPPWFRGGGQKFRINVQLGTRRKDFEMTFIEPWFLGRKLEMSHDLYYREKNYYSSIYDIVQLGTRVGLRKALGSDFLIGGISYTIEELQIKNLDRDKAPPTILAEPERRLVSKWGASLAYDTLNSVQLPDGGQRTELFTELAGPFGGDTDFYKLELRTSWYFPGFAEGHVFEMRGRSGVVEGWGRSENVPLFDRYFLGGVYTLRGYRFRKVGPHENDEPIGGETYWFGSLEYSIPIIERLRFALFYDIGNVYRDAYSFDRNAEQEVYNDNWGLGIRLNIPRLGPLRLDYGFPITHDRFSSGSGRFQFSVGFRSEY